MVEPVTLVTTLVSGLAVIGKVIADIRKSREKLKEVADKPDAVREIEREIESKAKEYDDWIPRVRDYGETIAAYKTFSDEAADFRMMVEGCRSLLEIAKGKGFSTRTLDDLNSKLISLKGLSTDRIDQEDNSLVSKVIGIASEKLIRAKAFLDVETWDEIATELREISTSLNELRATFDGRVNELIGGIRNFAA